MVQREVNVGIHAILYIDRVSGNDDTAQKVIPALHPQSEQNEDHFEGIGSNPRPRTCPLFDPTMWLGSSAWRQGIVRWTRCLGVLLALGAGFSCNYRKPGHFHRHDPKSWDRHVYPICTHRFTDISHPV